MIMELKFRINKYSQVFNRVGTSYTGLKKFIIVNQCISFSSERNNSGFVNTEFHEVSNAPILYRINVRLKSIAAVRRFNDTEASDIIGTNYEVTITLHMNVKHSLVKEHSLILSNKST
jgi:hypothetical protein